MKRGLSLSGIPVSPGVAVGKAVLWFSREDTAPKRSLEKADIAREVERFRAGAEAAAREMETTAEQVAIRLGPEYAAIFQAHALFLRDRAYLAPIERRIEAESVNAEWAVAAATESFAARMRDLPDEHIALRAADLRDVGVILRRHLGEGGDAPVKMEDLEGESLILVADELTPSDAVKIPRDRVVGFLSERGGKTSHASIIARSFGIPAVVAIPRLLACVADGDLLIIDGREGVVWREPSEDVLALFRERQEQEATQERTLKAKSTGKTVETLDGEAIFVRANIELVSEVRDVLDYGADGVGLFRSEFIYLSSEGEEFPDEKTQFAIYEQTVRELAPRPVVIRTYDLGGKKGARTIVGAEEINPVLGLRGVRLCFKKPEMFRTQLRALLKAAPSGELRILIPMVSGVEEIRRVRAMLEEERDALRQDRFEIPDVPLGAMIEVPSAAITVDMLLPDVDFLALGTNDLIQYTLAVDRANETVSELFCPHHPAILRLVARVAEAARKADKPVSVCGEMAADPIFFLVLVGLGIREFSMGPRSVPVLKEFARSISSAEAAKIARAALSLSTPEEVAALLNREAHNLLVAAGARSRSGEGPG
ncbi:MAG: phosphoenolpyruvate--protein phosphotransferase [Acidobacteria bacterium]|nr:phosphoenolpyruvate--protein phosphotransferase [Acidobacteriota bacterium]MCG3194299.1 Phosphoenolpyruvate-protein phosphotransferase [Thermoanaerobaculia bacterium]MCK6681921.1 phosphoenolpyruvate--protein phosphotransferase [Thermoanaerobaculia bacterium]